MPDGITEKMPHDHGHSDIEKLLCTVRSNENFDTLSSVFSQLADSTRLRIFWVLCHSEECVINLSAIMNMSSPAVSHHLSKLKACGLVTSRREGKEVYYRSAETEEAEFLHGTIEALTKLSCPK